MTIDNEQRFCGFTEAEVRRSLSKDYLYPIERLFLLAGMVCSWESESGLVLSHRIEDNRLSAATEAYLRSRGLKYSSLAAVYEAAKQQKWDGHWRAPEWSKNLSQEKPDKDWNAAPDTESG